MAMADVACFVGDHRPFDGFVGIFGQINGSQKRECGDRFPHPCDPQSVFAGQVRPTGKTANPHALEKHCAAQHDNPRKIENAQEEFPGERRRIVGDNRCGQRPCFDDADRNGKTLRRRPYRDAECRDDSGNRENAD